VKKSKRKLWNIEKTLSQPKTRIGVSIDKFMLLGVGENKGHMTVIHSMGKKREIRESSLKRVKKKSSRKNRAPRKLNTGSDSTKGPAGVKGS